MSGIEFSNLIILLLILLYYLCTRFIYNTLLFAHYSCKINNTKHERTCRHLDLLCLQSLPKLPPSVFTDLSLRLSHFYLSLPFHDPTISACQIQVLFLAVPPKRDIHRVGLEMMETRHYFILLFHSSLPSPRNCTQPIPVSEHIPGGPIHQPVHGDLQSVVDLGMQVFCLLQPISHRSHSCLEPILWTCILRWTRTPCNLIVMQILFVALQYIMLSMVSTPIPKILRLKNYSHRCSL